MYCCSLTKAYLVRHVCCSVAAVNVVARALPNEGSLGIMAMQNVAKLNFLLEHLFQNIELYSLKNHQH